MLFISPAIHQWVASEPNPLTEEKYSKHQQAPKPQPLRESRQTKVQIAQQTIYLVVETTKCKDVSEHDS